MSWSLFRPLEEAIFANSGFKLHNFYGSAECGGIAYDSSSEPRADVELTIGEDGCLEVRSDAVAATYWPESIQALATVFFAPATWLKFRMGWFISEAGPVIALMWPGEKCRPKPSSER